MSHPIFDLHGKVALVTGGSKGIGFAMAKALGEAHAKVVLLSRGTQEGERAASELEQLGIEASFYPCDVSKKEEIEDVVSRVVRDHGKIDILVNNAGTNIRKPLLEVEEEDWDHVLSINLKGIFLVAQAVAKHMIAQQYGKIINITSILGSIALPYQTSYAASKGGINQLTKVWAEELAPYNITVNAIGPGYIQTPMTEGWMSDPERYQAIVSKTMQNRVGTTEDLIGPILLLASDASRYMTGQILHVDGGWTAR